VVIRSSRSKACRAGSIAAWVVPARPSVPSKEPADSAIQGAESRRKSEELKLVRSRRRPLRGTPEAKEDGHVIDVVARRGSPGGAGSRRILPDSIEAGGVTLTHSDDRGAERKSKNSAVTYRLQGRATWGPHLAIGAARPQLLLSASR
jgi:hypothetical protein